MKIRGLFSAIDISSTGLSAQRRRMDAIAENIANVNTTRTPEGGPYRRRISVFSEETLGADVVHLRKDPDRKLDLETNSGNHLTSFQSMMKSNEFSGVKQNEIREKSNPEYTYDPTHPDANEFGYVAKPRINIITEMVEMIAATRGYEANVSAIEAAKSMARRAMDI